MDLTERISLTDATYLLQKALCANGVQPDVATSVAKALVEAEACGQAGHGFSRLDDYVAQVQSGKINSAAQIASSRICDTGIEVDADCGFAYPALDLAIAQGIEIAARHGTATMSVLNSHHCGSLAIQVEKLADAGMIGLMFANTPKAIAPWGATVPIFGTNPIAFSTPRAESAPLVIDLSLSVVARGKIMHAAKSAKAIPPGWALDAEGNPTTDPAEALAGTMVPIGQAKGSALALMVEILAAALTGAAFSKDASSFFSAEGDPPRVGQFLIAIDPGRNRDHYLSRVEALLTEICSLEGARLPGDRRLAHRTNAKENGLLVPTRYLDSARALAKENNSERG